jgi:hypothetical protein
MTKEQVACLHIAKTGGTSLQRDVFMKVWRPNEVLIYHPVTDTFRRGADLRSAKYPSIFAIKEVLKKTTMKPIVDFLVLQLHKVQDDSDITWEEISQIDHRVITGHFPANKLDIISGHFSTIVLRDPLERMYSHYLHWKRERGNTKFGIMTPYNDQLSFTGFAMLEQLQNYQTKALAGKSLSDFGLVGTTENLQLYVKKLLTHLNMDPTLYPIGYHNQTKNKPPIPADGEFIHKFKEFHSKDYQLYKQALGLTS